MFLLMLTNALHNLAHVWNKQSNLKKPDVSRNIQKTDGVHLLHVKGISVQHTEADS